MHLEQMRVKNKSFPQVAFPLEVRSARIWHCNFKSLEEISALQNLETLVVATWPDISFMPLASLKRLKYLSVLHFPKAAELLPIAGLNLLETLCLSSLPSWDASGKTLLVNSLEPVAQLRSLKHLELCGVRTPDRTLPLGMKSKALQSAKFFKYRKSEVEKFYAATGASDAFAPQPAFEATQLFNQADR